MAFFATEHHSIEKPLKNADLASYRIRAYGIFPQKFQEDLSGKKVENTNRRTTWGKTKVKTHKKAYGTSQMTDNKNGSMIDQIKQSTHRQSLSKLIVSINQSIEEVAR